MRLPKRRSAAAAAARTGVYSVLLVGLAVLLPAIGLYDPLERLLYDERARHCQAGRPPVAASLAHLDVDDAALAYLGHWPWPPSVLARVVDEVHLAGPRLLAFDVIFPESQGVVFGRNDPVGVDEDAVLAGAVRRLGCALVPASLHFEADRPPSRVRRALLPLLEGDPDRTPTQCLDLLRPTGLTAADLDAADPGDSFAAVREAAVADRIRRALAAPGPPPAREAVRAGVLPHVDPVLTGTVLGRVFDQQWDRVVRERAAGRFTLGLSTVGTTPLVTAAAETTPILPLGRAAAAGGFVDSLPDSVEGTVRTMPLLARYRDRVVPAMALSAACAALGADVRAVRLTADQLTIPLRGGAVPIVVPVSLRPDTPIGPVGALMDVPLFGRAGDWATMYDVPAHQRPARHTSVYAVWQACQTEDRLAANRASINRVVADATSLVAGPAAADAYAAAPPGGAALVRKARETVDVLGGIPDLYADEPPSDEKTRKLANAGRMRADLITLLDQTTALDRQLADLRAGLRQLLHDKVIFFGATATGMDQRPTALFGQCPGVVIHGAVFNAIVTRHPWRRAPAWVGPALTLLAAVAAWAVVGRLPPRESFAAAAALAGGYLAVNGWVLFARHGWVVDAAGPVMAVVLVWVGLTVYHRLAEVTDRARITRRLRMTVDPAIVDYFVQHPDQERFDGERRELTIGFSDLVGFTTMSDELGEQVVPLLADYVGRMLPVIRKDRRGTLDKQIGDGLCFIFGAPWPDPAHARHAVQTALDMHAALADFNAGLADRGLRPLGMRIGLATGDVIVGDAGPPDGASYTTLGGTTNLAARLESANKFFGTRTLCSARTVELLGDGFLCRPIANLQVAGKLSCCVVYEPLCPADQATDADRRLAAAATAVFDAYRRGDHPACSAAAAAMAAEFGPSRFTDLYAERSADGYPHPDDHCDGQIRLSEK